jgi:ribosomal-protein-serine acetyltransferase
MNCYNQTMSEQMPSDLPYYKLIVDDNLYLRQLEVDEAETVFGVVDENRKYLQKWLPWVEHTKSSEDSKAFIIDTRRKRREGTEYGYAVCVDDKPVGHMSLMHVTDGKDPEIGYWIASSVQGQGITTKAAKALTEFGLNILGLKQIVIKAEPGNIASNKVAEKLGYTLQETIHSNSEDPAMNIWSIIGQSAQ